jgi:hypothetical protein
MEILKNKINSLSDDKFKTILGFVKLNYLLIIFYPSVILLHLFFLSLYKKNDLLDLFVIISLSNQFDIGMLKNTFFHKKKYNLLIVVIIVITCLVLLSFLSMGILLLFDLSFQYIYLFVVFVGLLGNEFKSFYDSKSNYSIGFVIKNLLNFSVIYLFYNMITPSFLPLLILISLLAFLSFIFMYFKLNLEITNSIDFSDFKFFFLNIFAFASGNIDRFLVIPIIGFPLRNSYLYFTETNMKLYGLFGFLNNLFLYKQIKLSLKLILIIGMLLVFSVFSIYVIFDIDYNYLLFSFSLIISIFSQYYIYSKIGDLKGISISFFPVIGISIYLVLFYFINKFFNINLLILTIILIIKSLSELTFIYAINNLKLKQSN